MENFEGRVAVVTGAGSGMGRSIALTLAGVGVNVVIADIDSEQAEIVRSEAAAIGVKALAVPTDVSKLASVEALADAAYGEFGKVDILVNNAGVTMRPFRASWDTSYEDFRWVMGVNFWGVLHGHHVFVPRMRKQDGDKHIVNTSSMATLMDMPGHSAYTASKQAVDGLSLAAAPELATQSIGITILYPGAVDTRIPTSERLRPATEQSEKRGAKPWSDYLVGPSDANPQQNDPAMERISPDLVGPMVLGAIKENRRFCLTHPLRGDTLRSRVDEILGSYRSGDV